MPLPDADLINTRVRRGEAWLDHISPCWDEHIDADLLDMSDGQQCVLGQAGAHVIDALGKRSRYWGSDFSAACSVAKLADPSFDAVEMGFDCPPPVVQSEHSLADALADVFATRGEWSREYYAMLDCAWQALISERRERRAARAE